MTHTATLIVTAFFLSAPSVRAEDISATVIIGLCGDGVINATEDCEGANLGGASCTSLGYTGGTLSCTIACSWNTSQCTSPTPEGGTGSGGGGGATPAPQVSTASVVFSGVGYAGRTVTLLKDAQVATTVVSGSDGKFSVQASGLSEGSYLFSIYGTAANGLKSPLYSVPVQLAANEQEHAAQDIYLAPTIGLDKIEVRQGEEVSIFGTSAPGSQLTVLFDGSAGAEPQQNDADGSFIWTMDTATLARGVHTVRAFYVLRGKTSPMSKTVSFFVGDQTVPAALVPAAAVKGDLNGDGAVSLVDFSIMAYWYRRAAPPASVDLNRDGVVNLVDLSIMAFSWTG